ncbi:MAG: DUF2333 family protein [Desulfovibrionaceae bacterium]|nr:DUF2333 family protein [Desulfovibrionaceae bacterium]
MQSPDSNPSDAGPKSIFARRIPARYLIIAAGFILFWPVAFYAMGILNSLYDAVDPTRFAEVDESVKALTQNVGENSPPQEKGAILAEAIIHQLERELGSTFGWSANDILPTRFLDNRASRQKGVIFSTRMLIRFFSTRCSKHGAMGAEHEGLKAAREKRLVYAEDIWGFFHSSTESEYKKGIELVRQYQKELAAGTAVFNLRTDDIYDLMTYITGREFLDQPMGLLIQSGDVVSFSEEDDHVYYAQGAMLVVRDFLYALVKCYPSIGQKGGEENLKEAFRAMDKICSFDPPFVVEGSHDSMLADHRGKMARYYVTVLTRLNDVTQSVNR